MKRLLGMGAVLLCLCLAAGCVAAEDRKTPGYYDFPNTTGIGSAPSATSAAITTTTSTTNPLQSELDELRSRLSALEATTTRIATTIHSVKKTSSPPPATSTQAQPPEETHATLKVQQFAVGDTVTYFPHADFRVDSLTYFEGDDIHLPQSGRKYAIITVSMRAHGYPDNGYEYYEVINFISSFNLADGRSIRGDYSYGLKENGEWETGWLIPGEWVTTRIYKNIASDAEIVSLTFDDGYPNRAVVVLK